jgi:hypothetical protein
MGKGSGPMKKIFSSVEVSETVLVRDALVQHGIEASIQNQSSGYSSTPAFRPPAEVWIPSDADAERAIEIVRETLFTLDNTTEDDSWICSQCTEKNPPSFDLCWNCQTAK